MGSVKVCVVDSGEKQAGFAVSHENGLIEEQLQAGRFKTRSHLDEIVVAKDSINRHMKRSQHLGGFIQAGPEILAGAVSVIPGKNGNIIIDFFEQSLQDRR